MRRKVRLIRDSVTLGSFGTSCLKFLCVLPAMISRVPDGYLDIRVSHGVFAGTQRDTVMSRGYFRGWGSHDVEAGEGSGEGCSPEKGRGLPFLDEVVCHGGPARLRDHGHSRANDGAWSVGGTCLIRHQYTTAFGHTAVPNGRWNLQSKAL
jgi:hypothetical protein